MSGMIDKVAMAIWLEDKAMPPEGETDAQLMQRYSRTAIQALREPTEPMCEAGDLGDVLPATTWRAMVDEAVK